MRRSKWHRERSSDWSDVIGHRTWKTISFKKILAKLAGALEVSADELKLYDTREPIADLNRLMDSDPKLGFAFRTVVEKVKNGELTAEDIIVKLSKRKSRA
jgi:hypothetical protein